MKIKNYKDLTAQEQFEFVTALTEFANISLPRLEENKDKLTKEDRQDMSAGLLLIGAFPIYKDFVEQAFLYNDFSGRIYRLRHCIERIKKEIGKDVAVATTDGKQFAYVPALQQQFRRRGRPTREEAYAKNVAATLDETESKRLQAIARLLGMEIVTNQTLREKNNAELAVEREIKKQHEEKANPGLFGTTAQPQSTEDDAERQLEENTDGNLAAKDYSSPTIETLSPTRLHLDQVRVLLSPELQERVDAVRELRNRAADAAETAKRMTLAGKQPEEVAPFAQRAAELTEEYETVYDDVDTELATVYYRLLRDEDYSERFSAKYRVTDLAGILKQLKPYFLKKDSPEFELRLKTLIEQESPGYVARMKAEEEKKEEIQSLLRYIRRTDKPLTKTRLEGMRSRFARLQEIAPEEAIVQKPILDKAEEDFAKTSEASNS